MLLLATLLLIATTVSRNIADHVSPSMRSRPQVKSVQLGSSVEFVCSVANQDEHKVQWWFDNHNRQISSNADVLTDDTHKYNVWQPKGSSGVWILHISNVSVMDAGHYRCDISSTGLTMTSRLQVTEAVLPFVPRPENIPRANFTGCCMEMGVAQHCLPICSPPTFNPSSFDMERCDSYMTQLLHCGSDGSNHIPCCRRRHVPTQCLDICLGKLPKEMDESHMVCPRKTLDILACFEEGKLLLPGPPKGLLVRAISPTKLYVKWHAPDKNGDSVIGYYIFYQRGGSTDYRSSALVLDVSYRIENLDAATAYNLYVVAVNEHGTSLPSYIIHINTPQSRPNRRPPLNLFPDPGYLPECCRQHGVTQDCQPILCSDTPVQDRQHLRRCLPEFNKVLACFAGERNHTDCCVRREVPGVCLPLCGGAPSGVNFQLLSCMRYVSDISSCVREGYNSIPGPPLDVRLGKVTSHEASLEWDPPVYGRAPVKAYLVQYKEQSAVVYTKMTTTETSATLTTLRSSTLYTVKVSSLGHNGTSLPSPSLIFLTYSPSGGVLLSTTTTLIPPITPPPHDIARCCRNQTVEEHCLTLCNYDIDFRAISPEVVGVCTRNLHAILQCAVDGRNHTRCCQKRGVHAQCRKFCEFSQHDIDKYQLTDEDGVCVFEMPSLVQCMKEGVAQLPSPPRQLTAINTTLNTISLTWLAPAQQPQGVTGYLVEYHQAKLPGPWLPLKTSAPHVILQNLDPDTKYVIRVSAYNDLGESLPSYRLVQQTLTTPGAEKSLNFTAHINIEACCREKNVLAECMPACNNSASVTYKQCHLELPKLVVCSADGRDHSDCCKRREVPANCLGFCQGSLPKSAFISYLCMASLPQILTCFRVGLPMLPSPPRDFHLEGQGSRWLQFAWTQPLKNGHDVRYSLQYQESINDDIAWINTIDNIRTVQHKLDHLLPFRQYTVRVQAVNRFGNSVPSAKVVVWTLQETPLRVSISQAPPGYIREHATSVTLTCQAVGDPPPFIHWLRNGVIHNDSTYSLQGVRHSDTGRYTCVARNNIGKVSSLDHYIKIQFLPKVVANVTQITRSPGQVLLTCGFRGYPERISWSRDGQNITGPDGWHDRRFVTRVIDEKVGIVESRLTIVLATKSDYGTYLCRAENDFGAVDALLMLKDNSEEHIEPFHPTTKYSSLSECCEARGVSVKCRVACSFDVDLGAIKDALMNPLVCVPDLPAIIQCGADGKDHSQCCRNNRVPAECLAVCAGNVDALTSGHIACIAHIAAITTCMETGQKNIPSPPRNVKALLSHGYISVSWDAPAKNRDKVTFYKVNYRRATVGPTLQVKLGPQSGGVNLTRIHGHTQYYINVTSGNHHGNSAPSDTIVITTLELMPSAPRNFTGHLVDGMSVRLSWEMPIKNPGAILGYLITYAVSGAHTRHTENISDVLTYKLENLAPQTTYTIFVRAQSSHFIGPRSKVITVATQASEGYFQQHFGGTTKVGLGIGLTFAVMVMVVVVGFALFWHIRKRAGSEHQFEDSVAFENPTYTTAGTPRISGLPNGATSSLGSSTELVAGSIMKETDSSSSDQGYATLSTPTAPNKDDKTMATLHTSAASDV